MVSHSAFCKVLTSRKLVDGIETKCKGLFMENADMAAIDEFVDL